MSRASAAIAASLASLPPPDDPWWTDARRAAYERQKPGAERSSAPARTRAEQEAMVGQFVDDWVTLGFIESFVDEDGETRYYVQAGQGFDAVKGEDFHHSVGKQKRRR